MSEEIKKIFAPKLYDHDSIFSSAILLGLGSAFLIFYLVFVPEYVTLAILAMTLLITAISIRYSCICNIYNQHKYNIEKFWDMNNSRYSKEQLPDALIPRWKATAMVWRWETQDFKGNENMYNYMYFNG